MPTPYTQADDATRLLRHRLQQLLHRREIGALTHDRQPQALPADLRVELHNLLLLLWNNAEAFEIRDLFTSLNRCSGGATSLHNIFRPPTSDVPSSSESASPMEILPLRIPPRGPQVSFSTDPSTGATDLVVHLEELGTHTTRTITFMLPHGSLTKDKDGVLGMVVDLRSQAPSPTSEFQESPYLCYGCAVAPGQRHTDECDRSAKL